jgi:signal transduction histidine kinase
VELRVDLSPAVLPAEAGLLTTLLINLCDNARKASPPGGTVSVTGVWEGTDYVLTVKDNGIGMAPSELTRITEPFYMVDKSRARAQNGAGLGLSLCASIAEVHGSSLRFESAPGVGTVVSLRLKGGNEL